MLKYEIMRDPDGFVLGIDDMNQFNIYAPLRGIIKTLGKPHKASRSLLINKSRDKELKKINQEYKINKPLVEHLAHLKRNYLTLILRDEFDEWRIPLTWFIETKLQTTSEGVKEFYLVPLTTITEFSIMDLRTRQRGRTWVNE